MLYFLRNHPKYCRYYHTADLSEGAERFQTMALGTNQAPLQCCRQGQWITLEWLLWTVLWQRTHKWPTCPSKLFIF